MRALFVHGMGRTPVSGWPMLRQLQPNGIVPEYFAYFTAVQTFEHIQKRLQARIVSIAAKGEYVLIGHSLGGVLLRSALTTLPQHIRQPSHLFLIASPIEPARMAQRLAANAVFKAMTGDCGRFLASQARMGAIGPCSVPTTAIIGVRGLPLWLPQHFAGEPNDGVVAVSEVTAPWLEDTEQVEALHTWLPSSTRVAQIILQRLAAKDRA